jgi:prevent-host-death family protein
MYRSGMSATTDDIYEDVNLSEARANLARLVQRATDSHEPVYLSRHGQRVAALIDAATLARVLELAEDMDDILAAQAAREEMRQTGETPIPWDEVKADLGLV